MNVTQDLSIIELVAHASLVVKLVLALLTFVSVMSWYFIFRKWFELRDARTKTDQFEREFWSGGNLETLYQSAVNDRHLTIKALEMALKRRCPEIGLLHHSDQGCTYASEDYQAILGAQGIVCSMSRRGNCYDNAVMESFFSTI